MTAKKKSTKVVEKEQDIDMYELLNTIVGEEAPTIDIGSIADVSIKRVTGAQLYNLLDLFRGIIESTGVKSLSGLEDLQEKIQEPALLMELLMRSHDRMIDLVTGLCSLEKDQVINLEIDHLLLLMMAEWKVNESFFMTRVMGLVTSLFPRS